MIDNAYARAITKLMIETYANDQISVYKYASMVPTKDIYGQSTRTYDAPIVLVGVAITNPDLDTLTPIGQLNEEIAMFVFSIDELLVKLPAEPANEWITDQDVIEFDGIKFSIIDVEISGRVGNGPSMVHITGQVHPDTDA